jgi:hypothetical protein
VDRSHINQILAGDLVLVELRLQCHEKQDDNNGAVDKARAKTRFIPATYKDKATGRFEIIRVMHLAAGEDD